MPQIREEARRAWQGVGVPPTMHVAASRLRLPALSTLHWPETSSCCPTEIEAGVSPLAMTPSWLTVVALPIVTVALL